MAEEDTNFDYHPDGGASKERISVKPVSWEASEYIDHKQGPLWFFALALVVIALGAAAYFLAHDYFAVGAIVVVGVITGVFARHTPRKLSYELSADGLKIGEKVYGLNQYKSFSIIEEGPISSIELMPLKRFMPPLSAFFETKDQDKIVDVLANFLPYEDKEMDKVERLSRRLRF